MGKVGKIIAGAAVAAVTVATGGAAGFAIGFSWTSFAGSLILGGLSMALTPKPQKTSSNNFSGALNTVGNSTVAVRQPNMSRQHVYGHTRITRGYAHMQSTGLNGVLHMILILCEGELRSINEVWVNDYCIPQDWIDANGNVTQGRYAGYMTIRKHLGAPNQSADSNAVSAMPSNWSNDHRLRGTAYLYITMTKNQDIYPTGVPNISAVVEGPNVYDPRISGNRWTTNIALYANDFLRSTRYGYGVADDDIDDVNTAAQANICDEIVAVTAQDNDIVSYDVSGNTITIEGDILDLQFGDQIQIIGGTPPTGLSTGVSYYVIPYQVKTTPRIQLATSLNNAMDKVVIDFSGAGSGGVIRKTGEPRYHGSGIFDTEAILNDTLNDLCSSMAGRAIYIGGRWTLIAGAWRTPTIDLGIGDIRGNGMGFKNSLTMAQSFNEVKGIFVSPLNFYQNSDYPAAVYQQFIDDDNGVLSSKNINLPFTTRPTTAQRIAKIELFKGRQDIVFTATFSTKAFQLQPGDTVNLDIDRLGWENKPFEVTEFAFDVADGNLVTRLTLRETAQAIYDWSQGEAIDFDPAPNTNLPSPFDVLVPTGVKYNSRETGTANGDTVFSLQLQWDLHPDMFVREFGDFELQFKLSADPTWLPSFKVDGQLTQSDVLTSTVGVFYDLRIRAINNLGVRSNWVTLYNVVVGSSGGVSETRDYRYVYEPVGSGDFYDYGSVADAVTSSEDWGNA